MEKIKSKYLLKDDVSHKTRRVLTQESVKWLKQQKIRGFFSVAHGQDGHQAANSLMSSVGLGKLRPNMILMGFKRDWRTCQTENLVNYFNIIQLVPTLF